MTLFEREHKMRKMQYQIEFLDDANTIVRMMHREARSPAVAFLHMVKTGWPPGALSARVFDHYGRHGFSVSKPQAKSRRRGR